MRFFASKIVFLQFECFHSNFDDLFQPRFRRLLFYASILTVGAAILRKLALNDPVVELMMKQSDDEEERREKVRQSGLNYPVSYGETRIVNLLLSIII